MAQTGYTPLLIYASGTASNTPLAANLTSSASGAELALNYADGKLFYKDSGGTVQVLATKGAAQNSISFGTTGLTPSTATQGAVTVAGTLITSNGGTGLSSWTAGDLPYYATGTALSKLGIGTNGQVLTSNGSAPQWTSLSSVGVTTFSAGTTGFTPSSATSGAVTLAGTLATTNGGTGLTSFTANGVMYASSSSALATGSALTFDGTSLGVGTGTIPSGVKTVIASPNTAVNSRGNLYVYTTDTATADYGAQLALGGSFSGTAEAPFAAIAGRWVGGTTGYMQFSILNSGTIAEQMRLTSTGLGIGTSSPAAKLHAVNTYTNTSDATIIAGGNIPGINLRANGGARMSIFSNYATADSTSFLTSTGGANPSAEVLRFDHSNGNVLVPTGNIGLGVTPSAWSLGKAFEVGAGGNGLWTVGNANIYLVSNTYYASGAYRYASTNAASAYEQENGVHKWRTAASGTADSAITFTQAMTLDASGNLLVGGSSSLSYRSQIFAGTNGYTQALVQTSAYNSGNLSGTVYSGYYDGSSITDMASIRGGKENTTSGNYGGMLAFYTRSNGGSDTERARIDSSGNLGLGVTPSTWDSSIKALQVKGISVAGQDAGSGAWILSNARNNGGTWYYQANGYAQQYEISANNGQHRWSIAPSGTAGNAITFTQAMTLDASGYFLVGTTSNAYNGRITSEQVSTYAWAYVSSAANSGGTYFHIEFRPAGGSAVGNITSTSTTTSYNTSSDYRLKNIDGPLTGSGAFIDALKPKVGTWKANGSKFVGFLAHEVQEVSPNSVFGEKDGEQMQAMEYGSAEFIANIIAELQSLRARVAQLEAKGA